VTERSNVVCSALRGGMYVARAMAVARSDRHAGAIVEYKGFPGRSHWPLGHPAGKRWRLRSGLGDVPRTGHAAQVKDFPVSIPQVRQKREQPVSTTATLTQRNADFAARRFPTGRT
jgi:hypothetical protein